MSKEPGEDFSAASAPAGFEWSARGGDACPGCERRPKMSGKGRDFWRRRQGHIWRSKRKGKKSGIDASARGLTIGRAGQRYIHARR